MADIELVIKIPEELKEALDNAKKENAFNYMRVYNDTIYNAIKNGTSLPTCHGKLIDADTLIYLTETCIETTDAFIGLVQDMPPIIEADSESEVYKQ